MPQIPTFLRTAVERLSRGRTFARALQVGNCRVKILVSGDAQLKYLKVGSSPFDQDLIDIAQTCLEPQDVVWDIGANIGVFSVAAATCAKRVVAFEADIWLAELIRGTTRIKENDGLDIQVVPAALSDQTGLSVFQIAKRGRASNALKSAGGRSQMGGAREEVLVPTFSLDAMYRSLGAPSFIKIDVEGAEMMVLSGGHELFAEKEPMVYAEVGSGIFDQVAKFFSDLGYSMFNDRGEPIGDGVEPTPNLFFAKDGHLPRLSKFQVLVVGEHIS